MVPGVLKLFATLHTPVQTNRLAPCRLHFATPLTTDHRYTSYTHKQVPPL